MYKGRGPGVLTWKGKQRTGFVRQIKCVHLKDYSSRTGFVRQIKCVHLKDYSSRTGFVRKITCVSQKKKQFLFQMPAIGDQVYYITERFTVNSCIGVGKFRVVGCETKTRKVATTAELLSVEVVDASCQLNEKLRSLQDNMALQLAEKENLLFQLEALKKQLDQRNKSYETLQCQWTLWKNCAEGHKKAVEDLQSRNRKLMQQLECLQDDYECAVEELEDERQKHQQVTAQIASRDAMGHHHTLYQMLLVPPEASAEQITAHFRKLSVLSHPDKGGDAEIFKRLQQAHRILENREARTTYEAKGIEAADNLLCELMN